MNTQKKPAKVRRRYTPGFKADALAHWDSSGLSANEVAAKLGIPSGQHLYDWRKQSARHPAPHGAQDDGALAARVADLEHELAVMTERCDILKKSLGIFVEPPRKSMPSSKR